MNIGSLSDLHCPIQEGFSYCMH